MEAEQRKKQGNRLKECMEDRATLWTLSVYLTKATGRSKENPFSEKYISQMRNGYRSIPNKYVYLIAEHLGIEAGYLIGDDDFEAGSYAEYLQMKDREQDIIEHTPELRRKANILELAGYHMIANFGGQTTYGDITYPFTITVYKDDKPTHIHIGALEQIEKEVSEYATELLEAATRRCRPKTFETPEEFEEALKKANKK